MKKLFLILAITLGPIAMFTPLSEAVTEVATFDVNVNVPPATGISISAVEVIGTSFGTTPVTEFNFGFVASDYKSNLGIWLPAQQYAIDVGIAGGGGSTDITVQYEEGVSPDDQPANRTLGYKTVATFFTITGGPAPADQTTTLLDVPVVGSTTLLKNLIGTGANINPALLNGGFFRALIGIYPGDSTAITADGGTPFTNADYSGDYSGTLTVSATLVI